MRKVKIWADFDVSPTTFATIFATMKILLKIKKPVSTLLTGLYKCGADETRTRDLLRDRQAF